MKKVSGNASATFFDFQDQFVMFYIPKSKQIKESVRISLEFENRDAIAYLLRTGHIDGMPTALEFATGK